MQRARAGFCTVHNPFRPSQVYSVSLDPESVKAIFFWTRWPEPIVPHLDELESMGHRFIFHVTLTGLPAVLEPFPHSIEERIESINRLAGRIGRNRVWWRYDPIIVGEKLDASYHLSTFERLAEALQASTGRVTLSLVDWYRKTERRISAVEEQTGPLHRLRGNEPDLLDLVGRLGQIARKLDIAPTACCEPGWEQAGVPPGACIDAEAANSLFSLSVSAEKDPGQRPDCRCALSYDIGATNTCIGGCVYCYSTSSHDASARRHGEHDPETDALAPPTIGRNSLP